MVKGNIISGICALALFSFLFGVRVQAASVYVDLNLNSGYAVDDPKMINAIDLNSTDLNSAGIPSYYSGMASSDVLAPLTNGAEYKSPIASVGRVGLKYDGTICDGKSPKLLSLSYVYEYKTNVNFKNNDGLLTFASFDRTKSVPILEYSNGGVLSNGGTGNNATGEGQPGGLLNPGSDLSQGYVYVKYDLSGHTLGELYDLMLVQVNEADGTKSSTMTSYAPIKIQLEYDDGDASCSAKQEPPVTEHDNWSTPQDTAITLDVAANDHDPNNDILTIGDWWIDSGDVDGTLELIDGKIVYTPSAGYVGDTTIVYVISDGYFKVKGLAHVNVYPYNKLDGDDDGSPTEVEDAAPNNGDNNYDGILDSKQKDVTSVANPVTGLYQTLVISGASCGDHQVNGYAVNPESENAVFDGSRDYPLGFNNFKLDCGDKGQTAVLDIIYDKAYNTSCWEWVKFNTITNNYMVIPVGANLSYRTDSNGRTVAQLSLLDGGIYDMDGEINGQIVDPSGPAPIANCPATTTPTTPTSNTEATATTEKVTLASTGVSIYWQVLASTALIVASAFGTRLVREVKF